MNQTDTNKRIAEKCGKCTCNTYSKPGDWETAVCDRCGKNPFFAEHQLPNYTESLDAMAEAEATLTEDQAILFRFILSKNSDGRSKTHSTVEAAMCHATAAQRAAAFLAVVEGLSQARQ